MGIFLSQLASRKFTLAIIAMMLLTGTSIASVWSPTLSSMMPTFIGGLLGILGLYFTGNVGQKVVESKVDALIALQKQSVDTTEDEDEEGED